MQAASTTSLDAERFALANGIPVLFSRATANPSVVVRAMLRAGAAREAPADQGLAGMVGRMLRQGSENVSKQELAEELDGMGAGLSIDVGYALTTGSIKCLSDDFRRSTEILAEVLRRPLFPAEEWERVRGQALTDLKEMNDNTRVVAERAWREMAYPADHRYHRLPSGTEETLARFTTDDLRGFFRRWYGANQVSLIVVGDVEGDQVREVLGRAFGDWGDVDGTPIEDSLPPTDAPEGQAREEAMVGKTQADVVLGLPTLGRLHEDYYALAFANHILGRIYFMGRFGEKVRDEQGLAYYAYSDLGAGLGRGPWTVRAGVNPRNLDQALASIRTEIDRFLADGPTEAEQTDGVASLLGSLPRQLESNEGTAAVLSEIELYDLGLDYLDRYPDIIRGLTREGVTATARRWLKPDQLITAIAGPARED